ncbi:MAG: hypothetical protein HKN47_23350 [Pirellulaceae bacterium]|nr:hypothetical protein [Pirellulaceae bacterium]
MRKRIDQLAAADLDTYPVWEIASDEEGVEGRDEQTVRPCNFDGPVDPKAGIFFIRSTFTLDDGSTAVGYVTPPYNGDSDLGAIQPVIVTSHEQIMFWWGVLEPSRDWINAAYRQFDRPVSQIFPIQFCPMSTQSAGRFLARSSVSCKCVVKKSTR